MAKCSLCLKNNPLVKSHYIPRALYKLCKDESNIIKNPINFLGTKAISTSNQSYKPFLCEDCEKRFSKFGESYVIDNCLRSNNDFKLREILEKNNDYKIIDEAKVYLGKQVLQSNLEYYKYFTASLVWRGSVTTWPFMGYNSRKNPLGTRYQEEFRQYLLGQSKFPSNAFLLLIVSEEKDLKPIIVLPNSINHGGIHLHHLYIPGIEIKLFVGNRFPDEFELIRKNNKDEVIIFLESFRNSELYGELCKISKKAEMKGKLKNVFDNNLN